MVCSSSLSPVFQFLCDEQAAWGIVLESLAAAGVLVTVILMVVLLFMVPCITDCAKRSVIPIQLLFLVGTLGIFGLTFAFIIRLTAQTCPTRFFLFGVLFALCFTCLLAHACKLVRLVRGGLGISGWVMLLIVVCLWLIQCLIAILYVILVIVKGTGGADRCVYTANAATLDDFNKDFVMVLIYVYFLMVLTFILSFFTFCGSCTSWRQHGIHIYVTMFFSIAIWIVWIVMLLAGNESLGRGNTWDDPVLAIALVANGWVFLLTYMIPEMFLMIRLIQSSSNVQHSHGKNQPKLLRQTYGVENRVFAHEDQNPACDSGRTSPVSQPQFKDTLPMKEFDPNKEFTIPRPQHPSWAQYRTHHLAQQ